MLFLNENNRPFFIVRREAEGYKLYITSEMHDTLPFIHMEKGNLSGSSKISAAKVKKLVYICIFDLYMNVANHVKSILSISIV